MGRLSMGNLPCCSISTLPEYGEPWALSWSWEGPYPSHWSQKMGERLHTRAEFAVPAYPSLSHLWWQRVKVFTGYPSLAGRMPWKNKQSSRRTLTNIGSATTHPCKGTDGREGMEPQLLADEAAERYIKSAVLYLLCGGYRSGVAAHCSTQLGSLAGEHIAACRYSNFKALQLGDAGGGMTGAWLSIWQLTQEHF